MRKKHLFSLLMLSTGVALLIAAIAAGGAMSATKGNPGGTLTIGSIGRVSSVDPQAAYDTRSWTAINLTAMTLINYPDSNAAGTPLQLQGAASFPVISKNKKTYTWTVKTGMQFSDGSYVTAASYKRAIMRILSPCQYAGGFGHADGFDADIVGGTAFNSATCGNDGQTSSVPDLSGVTATAPAGGGGTLTIHLTKVVPSFEPAMAMMWFSAVPADTPYDGDSTASNIPGAGPYHVTSYIAHPSTGDVMLTLGKNSHYNGPRLSNPNVIRYVKYAKGANETCYNDVVASNIDIDMCGLTATETTQAQNAYGAVTTTGVDGATPGTNGRFHVENTGCTGWVAENTQAAPTNNSHIRAALGYILDKDGILSVLGAFAGSYGSSILSPQIPGYKPDNVYGHKPNWTKAIKAGGKALKNKTLNIWYAGDSVPAQQQFGVMQSNINAFSNKYHLNVTVNGQSNLTGGNYYDEIGTYAWAVHGGTTPDGPVSPMNLGTVGWCADYIDAFDYLNVMFGGSTIVTSPPQSGGEGANTNYSYANIGSLNSQMNAAAKFFGSKRNHAYHKVDLAIVKKWALAVPFEIIGTRALVSANLGNWHYNEYQTTPALNMLTVQ